MKKLNLNYRFTKNLPADEDQSNSTRQVFGACYSWVEPKPTTNPQLLIYSPEVASLLDLNEQDCASKTFTNIFSGNALLEGSTPYAMCYGGHQFGHWAGQLGDGRAINLAEVTNNQGEHWSLQLKGAGPTPYSRKADGLAVLRSSVREFLCSEAMFHLGVPTTRALSLCATGDSVLRDMFYDGRADYEHGAVVCRVAPSFLRFGNFEIFSAREDLSTLKTLLDFTISNHFSHLISEEITTDTYLAWFAEVCDLTKEMIIHWQRVGFVHGVMNTDNMSILGLTIDYGPYGWLEDYNPDWTPNTTDNQHHRYAYGKQAQISHWNLMKLAQAIAPLFSEVQPLQAILDSYANNYRQAWLKMMTSKLGFASFEEEDQQLIDELLDALQLVETDMTIFYRTLANISKQNSTQTCLGAISEAFYNNDLKPTQRVIWLTWFKLYLSRLEKEKLDDKQRQKNMNAINPKYVLRNYLAQLVIDKAEQGDLSMLHEILDVLRSPYTEQAGKDEFAKKRPDWARDRAGCSMLSCSS